MSKSIEILIFPGFQILDAAGPIAAFEIADRFIPGSYSLRLVASKKGTVQSSSGTTLIASPLSRSHRLNTLLVVGGEGSCRAMHDFRLLRYVCARSKIARRVASVCSGAYLLGAAGLLDDRIATTHWSHSEDFARRFPQVRLEADHIYTKDGKFWCSAGITAGIDLALALVAEDLGDSIARKVAQHLVVYYRRPGGQSQFSPLLQMERTEGRFIKLLGHIRENLHHHLDVAELARFSCLSQRHFSRLFRAEFGMGPAKAVERIRVDAARAALEIGAGSVKRIALDCGFGDTERMRRSFKRVLGTVPSALRVSQGRPYVRTIT